jgi:hypothetical protein
MKKVDAAIEQKIKDYVFARDAERKWKGVKDGIRDEITEALGTVEDGDLVTDADEANVLLTIKVITSYRLNQKLLRAQHPDAYAKCQEMNTQIRLETPK